MSSKKPTAEVPKVEPQPKEIKGGVFVPPTLPKSTFNRLVKQSNRHDPGGWKE